MQDGAVRDTVQIRSLGEKPPASAIILSILVHCVALLLFLTIRFPAGPKLVPHHYELAKVIPLKPHVSFAPHRGSTHGNGGRSTGHSRPLAAGPAVSNPKLSAGEALQKEAKQYSAAMMNGLKMQMIYGFYPGHRFQLPLRQSGDLPHISRDQVPPRFEQIVLIDIIIDTEGKVADARIVAGLVDPSIQKILLAAVREFKYTPATRDEVPIPSQVEIVIPVPS